MPMICHLCISVGILYQEGVSSSKVQKLFDLYQNSKIIGEWEYHEPDEDESEFCANGIIAFKSIFDTILSPGSSNCFQVSRQDLFDAWTPEVEAKLLAEASASLEENGLPELAPLLEVYIYTSVY